MSEWSSSSKGRRGEASSRFTTLMSSVATCSRRLTSLLLCRILQFPRPVKLDDLRAKAKVAFGQTMDLHYTNNEVWSQKNSQTCTILKISWNKKKKYIYTRVPLFFFSCSWWFHWPLRTTSTRRWSCWIEAFTWRVWRSSWCSRISLRSADSVKRQEKHPQRWF